MTVRLLTADEICEPFGLDDDSKVILGNYIAWLIKEAEQSPDAEEYGDLLIAYIDKGHPEK